MKFLHIADIHLGAAPNAGTSYSDGRAAEIWESFSHVIDVCNEQQADLLLIAGDMFHRQPLLRELKEVDYLFRKLTHTKVVFIAGNHDYLKRDSYYRTFLWSHNVYPLLNTEMDHVYFEDLQTAVYGFSYDRKEIPENRYDEAAAPGTYPVEILLAHGGDEKHIPINRNKIMSLNYDYIALGHIHKPTVAKQKLAAFSGSLEPLDKNETGKHGYITGEITREGTQISFVPSAKRSYIHLTIQVDEGTTAGALRENIRTEIAKAGTQHLYKIIVKGYYDPDIRFDLESMDVYGNILEIEDKTKPALDFDKLLEKNRGNLLGRYIEKFQDSEEGSVEYQALYEGVKALCRFGNYT